MRLLTYLSRMFLPDLYTPEGFRIAGSKQYSGPEDTIELPLNEKRTVAICNLFSNQKKPIDAIARLLDLNRRSVISVLIHEGLILDRRQSSQNSKDERRQPPKYHLPLTLASGQIHELRTTCGQSNADTVSEFLFHSVLRYEERCTECEKRSSREKW